MGYKSEIKCHNCILIYWYICDIEYSHFVKCADDLSLFGVIL